MKYGRWSDRSGRLLEHLFSYLNNMGTVYVEKLSMSATLPDGFESLVCKVILGKNSNPSQCQSNDTH